MYQSKLSKIKNIFGFSLLELLICLTVLSIVVIFTSPCATFIYQQNKSLLIAFEIKSAINFAKLEAISRGEKLILSCMDGNDWSSGMRLYSANTKFAQDYLKSNLIREWQWASSGNIVTWKGFQSSKSLVFMPDMNKSAINGKFVIRFKLGKPITLIVNRLGRVYSEYETKKQLSYNR